MSKQIPRRVTRAETQVGGRGAWLVASACVGLAGWHGMWWVVYGAVAGVVAGAWRCYRTSVTWRSAAVAADAVRLAGISESASGYQPAPELLVASRGDWEALERAAADVPAATASPSEQAAALTALADSATAARARGTRSPDVVLRGLCSPVVLVGGPPLWALTVDVPRPAVLDLIVFAALGIGYVGLRERYHRTPRDLAARAVDMARAPVDGLSVHALADRARWSPAVIEQAALLLRRIEVDAAAGRLAGQQLDEVLRVVRRGAS